MILDVHVTPAASTLPPLPGAILDLQCEVASWFNAGHEVLWIPIYEVASTTTGIAEATAMAERHGEPRLIRAETDFLALPLGIKGWLFPAHLDDTAVVCVRDAQGEISLGYLQHPGTGQRLTWRYPTEHEL
jgi:hypothetical protein